MSVSEFLQGWLVDLVNRFGNLGGFSILQERICSGESLSVPLLAALLRLVIVTLHSQSVVHVHCMYLFNSLLKTNIVMGVIQTCGYQVSLFHFIESLLHFSKSCEF